jgi:dihydroneopterin aldolase
MEQGVIELNDLQFYAYHGCLEEEGLIGGNFVVDLNIFTNYSEAAKNDDLSLTVDYCAVYDIVKDQMMIRSKLIENVAYRIAISLKRNLKSIDRVEVRVTKITPPVNGDLPSVTVSYVI